MIAKYEYEDEDQRATLAAGRLGDRPTINNVRRPGSGLPVGLPAPQLIPPSNNEVPELTESNEKDTEPHTNGKCGKTPHSDKD
jgi:hypothetical protein